MYEAFDGAIFVWIKPYQNIRGSFSRWGNEVTKRHILKWRRTFEWKTKSDAKTYEKTVDYGLFYWVDCCCNRFNDILTLKKFKGAIFKASNIKPVRDSDSILRIFRRVVWKKHPLLCIWVASVQIDCTAPWFFAVIDEQAQS